MLHLRLKDFIAFNHPNTNHTHFDELCSREFNCHALIMKEIWKALMSLILDHTNAYKEIKIYSVCFIGQYIQCAASERIDF